MIEEKDDCPNCDEGWMTRTRVGPGIGEPALQCWSCDHEVLLA